MNAKIAQAQDNLPDIRKFLRKVLRYWPLFVVSLIIGVLAAYFINRYTPKVYPVSATLLIKSGSESNMASAVEILYGNDIGTSKNLVNESQILKSFPLIKEVVLQLDFIKSFYKEGKINTSEIYKDIPVELTIAESNKRLPYGRNYVFSIRDQQSYFFYTYVEDAAPPQNSFYSFGDTVDYEGFKFVVTKKGESISNSEIGERYIFRLNNPNSLAKQYSSNLAVTLSNKGSSILLLSISGTIPEKQIDFLNKLIELYINSGLEEKNSNATNTIEFIDLQLANTSDSLFNIESQIESFKIANQSPNISQEARSVYERLLDFERNMMQFEMDLNYYDYILDYINDSNNLEGVAIPSTVGISDNLLNQLISEFVKLQTEKKAMTQQGQMNNPYLSVLNDRIANLKNNILENIQSLKEATLLKRRSIQEQITRLEAEMQKLPGAEREFINIERKYKLSENLYIFLMQKRAEAGIAKASAVPDASVVEPPMQAGGAIAPQTSRNYLAAIFIALTIPLAFVFLKDYFNNKIQYKEDLVNLTDIPFLGVVGHDPKEENLVVSERPRSAVAESFRSVRSNLNFFTPNRDKKIFLITSSISGEGKSFCSINLATVYSISGKKTLLIGADLRKPGINKNFHLATGKGLSNYLVEEASLQEIIQSTQIPNLDLISGGPIPPNPAELLMNGRLEQLLEALKKDYQYIIIDTPPIGLVTDAFAIMGQVDHTIYLVRQSYTPIETIKHAQGLFETGKLANISILFNDVKVNKYDYGYEYGYAYAYGNSQGYFDEDKKKNWIRKALKKRK